jgi:outer membrane lipoprotein-sorting protein
MLKTSCVLAALSAVLLAAPPDDDKASEARAVVDKAIKAMGGADKLGKSPATTFQCKGTMDDNGRKGEMSGTWSVMLPNKYRAELELSMPGGNVETVTLVINGDSAWAKDATRNKVEEAPADAIKLINAELGGLLLVNNLTALTGKDVELSPLGEVKIEKRAAVGVKVKRKDLPDFDLFFDKETNLPAKAEVSVKEMPNAEETKHTFHFSGFKEADGVKHFTKLTFLRADKETVVMELSEVKRLEKLDPKLFEKPE